MLNSVALKNTCSYIVGSICSRNMCGPGIVTVLLLSIVPSVGDELLLPKDIFLSAKQWLDFVFSYGLWFMWSADEIAQSMFEKK